MLIDTNLCINRFFLFFLLFVFNLDQHYKFNTNSSRINKTINKYNKRIIFIYIYIVKNKKIK